MTSTEVCGFEDQPVAMDFFTRAEFRAAVLDGWLTPDDGAAIIVGGEKAGTEWDWMSPFPKDATGVEWWAK